MNTLTKHSWMTATLTALALSAGCATDGLDDAWSDADAIAGALELENGGLDMEDELPYFGDEELLAEAGLDDRTTASFNDAMADDDTVRDLLGQAEAVIYHASVQWGQIPANRENDTRYDWSGTLSVNRGAIIVRSVVAFDGRFDRIERRTDRQVVEFSSITEHQYDGMRLEIIDPDPAAAEPLVLTYTGNNGGGFSASIRALLSGPQTERMDTANNRIVAVAIRQPTEVCEHGFLTGRWHRVEDGRGRLLGRVLDADGDVLGHMRGIWGVRGNGQQVFFGKFIDRAGSFRGLYRGTYTDGTFRGRWLLRSGEVGGLGGDYLEGRPGSRVSGHFSGRWAETGCNLPEEERPGEERPREERPSR